MTEIALAEKTWLERARTLALPSLHGQPSRADAAKRQPEVLADILQSLSEGASYASAAAANGVTARTLSNWREADPEFDALCKEAVGKAYRKRELNVANDKNYKSQLAWLAARKHVFADPDWTSQQSQGSSGITVNITVRQDDTPTTIDVTPEKPVLDHDQD